VLDAEVEVEVEVEIEVEIEVEDDPPAGWLPPAPPVATGI